MPSKLVAVLRIFIILSTLQKVSRSIDCYQCNSIKDADCNFKSVDPKYLKPCPKTHNFCRKSNSIYYFTESREYVTVRECASLRNERNECYLGRYSRDSYQRICECKDSACNTSTSIKGISWIVTVSRIIILSVFLYFV